MISAPTTELLVGRVCWPTAQNQITRLFAWSWPFSRSCSRLGVNDACLSLCHVLALTRAPASRNVIAFSNECANSTIPRRYTYAHNTGSNSPIVLEVYARLHRPQTATRGSCAPSSLPRFTSTAERQPRTSSMTSANVVDNESANERATFFSTRLHLRI
ncbi:hypothetical protein EVG20_g4849 [Dentipellis fragilis]|uniref:Uncharacterized protein n=1 Tax=Dentipellis fragilis TaxID=205917 RepID=A0A4Y9YYN4_9AGAM|nr:hypothetical protein EVG20_g4849 [Dentipellis fragilis]